MLAHCPQPSHPFSKWLKLCHERHESVIHINMLWMLWKLFQFNRQSNFRANILEIYFRQKTKQKKESLRYQECNQSIRGHLSGNFWKLVKSLINEHHGSLAIWRLKGWRILKGTAEMNELFGLLIFYWRRSGTTGQGYISSLVKLMTLAASAQANVFGSFVQSNYSSFRILYAFHKPSAYRSSGSEREHQTHQKRAFYMRVWNSSSVF